MRKERTLISEERIYGKVKGYYEDNFNYTFVVNGKDIIFPKATYKLIKTEENYNLTR